MTRREMKEAKRTIEIAKTEVNMMLFYLKKLRFLSKAKYPDEEPVRSSIETMKNGYKTWEGMFEADKAEAYRAIMLIKREKFSRKTKGFGKSTMPIAN